MTVYAPYCEVVFFGADGVTYGTHYSGANFIKARSVKLKRSKQQTISSADIEFANIAGAFNSSIQKDSVVWIYTGAAADGSGKVKKFVGTVVRVKKYARSGAVSTINVTCRDATFDLLNAWVKNADIEPGGTFNGVTINDYADVVRGIMASPVSNPNNVTTNRVSNVGNNIPYAKHWRYKPTLNCLQELAVPPDYDLYVDTSNDLHYEQKANHYNAISLTSGLGGNVEAIEEDLSFEDEKTEVYAYCGQYSGTNVVAKAGFARTGNRVKSTWKRNINIGPNASSLAEAKAACGEWAKTELNKLTIKHGYRVTLNQFVSAELGDIFYVTVSDLALDAYPLQLTEVEETFRLNKKYEGVFILTEVVGAVGPQG